MNATKTKAKTKNLPAVERINRCTIERQMTDGDVVELDEIPVHQDYFLVTTDKLQPYASKGSVLYVEHCAPHVGMTIAPDFRPEDIVLIYGKKNYEIKPVSRCKAFSSIGDDSDVIAGRIIEIRCWPRLNMAKPY